MKKIIILLIIFWLISNFTNWFDSHKPTINPKNKAIKADEKTTKKNKYE